MEKVTKNKINNIRFYTKKVLANLAITIFPNTHFNDRKAYVTGMKACFHEIVVLP